MQTTIPDGHIDISGIDKVALLAVLCGGQRPAGFFPQMVGLYRDSIGLVQNRQLPVTLTITAEKQSRRI
jgi:uncharacterized protein (DUF1684 family)